MPDPAHAPKVQTMPDFVDLAAKLSPAVVNISTDEADEPAGRRRSVARRFAA